MSGIRSRDRGQLEAEVLSVLRAHAAPVGAGEIRDTFAQPQPAYTTLLTVLDRLVAKGEVVREEESPRKVRFAAAHTEAESASASMLTALAHTEDRRAVLMKFAGDLDEDDIAVLRSALGRKKR